MCVALEDLICGEHTCYCVAFGGGLSGFGRILIEDQTTLFLGLGDVRYIGHTIDYSFVLLPLGGFGCWVVCEVEMGVGCCWSMKA